MTLTIIGYTGLAAATLGATLAALYPRLDTFNRTSQGHQIAMARAETCQVLNFVQVNTIPIDGQTKRPLASGTLVCDYRGNTAQINGYGAADWVRTGQPEQIAAKLTARGFKQTY